MSGFAGISRSRSERARRAGAARHGGAEGLPGSATALADFSHTGQVTGLAFLDAAGSDITSAVTYTFLHGTQIGAVVTAAPEPSTLALLAAGPPAPARAARRRRGA